MCGGMSKAVCHAVIPGARFARDPALRPPIGSLAPAFATSCGPAGGIHTPGIAMTARTVVIGSGFRLLRLARRERQRLFSGDTLAGTRDASALGHDPSGMAPRTEDVIE